jgi:hypothetical protein
MLKSSFFSFLDVLKKNNNFEKHVNAEEGGILNNLNRISRPYPIKKLKNHNHKPRPICYLALKNLCFRINYKILPL